MFIIENILLIYFGLAVLYVFIISFTGRVKPVAPLQVKETPYHKIAVLVPAYKEDAIIAPVVEKLLQLRYPKEFFDIVVIADSLKKSTLSRLHQLPCRVIEVHFEKSTKTKSLVKALQVLNNEYEVALISDADNIMAPDYLQKINRAFNNGYTAVQGQRVAKNMDTPFAVLDALSEVINNHVFRKGFNAMGFSSSLIGSGMAFKADVLLDCLKQINAVGGFDRVLQLYLIERKQWIYYLEDAIVFDEKVDNSEAFSKQRRRWIASQFIYLKRYFAKGIKQLLKGNIDYFNAGVLYNIFLPRTLTLGFLFLFAVTALSFPQLFSLPQAWIGLFAANVLALLIAVPLSFYNQRFFKAILSLPKVFWIMFTLLFKLKGADKQFIHTVKTKVEVDNTLYSSHGK
ncbi:glycosyltransferase family 2 protein [Rapidithrix thailandica]|uniref:Glycosyltransferase family 2 protein n=1 Tax=Rapidithrix thailandica TaxID=413964 RepID=A0AAW9SCQ0_9BACT